MDTVYNVALGITKPNPRLVVYDKEIEEAVQTIAPKLESVLQGELNSRWVALRLLDGDKKILSSICEYLENISSLDKDTSVGREGGVFS